MPTESSRKAKEIFLAAVEIRAPDDRRAFLDHACDTDGLLRRRVEALLIAHERPESLLDRAPLERDLPPTAEGPACGERPGVSIGPYILREQIGEGGMGTVFVADQQKPLRRRVALKVIKPGMDTKAVIGRFEAERQALAVMDHPNIAKVFDAGTTENGRPYFVMELVRGMEIVQYCDEHKLSIRERLELLATVCHAIQHAHQKGIIHRDIKPSNVLVTEQDGKPVAKVIDFGVAKAIGHSLTERTVYTSFQTVIGTPLYMSPEQAALSNVDVDTRSDVYSLGVLLYELITGSTPFDTETLRNAAQDEVLRLIREHNPPKPSTKISTLGERATAVSQGRQTDIAGLGRAVRGDLDWIVMKAMEKERGRRYQTATDFAADISRFLKGNAIDARPPSKTYRLRKTISRHRIAFGATGIVMLALMIALSVSLYYYGRATAVLHQLHDQIIEKAILAILSGDQDEEETAITLARQADVPDTLLNTVQGIADYHAGESRQATERLTETVKEDPDNLLASAMLAIARVHAGQWTEYVRQMDQIELMNPHSSHPDHEVLLLGYAYLYFDTPRSCELLQHTVDKHPSWLIAHSLLGAAYSHMAADELNPAQALEHSKKGLRETAIAFELLRDNPVVAMYYLWSRHVAIHLAEQEGAPINELCAEADSAVEALEGHLPNYLAGAFNIAIYYHTIGRHDEGMKVFSEAMQGRKPDNWTYHFAAFLVQHGMRHEALRLYTDADLDTPSDALAEALLSVAIPDRRKRVRAIAQALILDQGLLDAQLNAVHILCLLGEREAVQVTGLTAIDALEQRHGKAMGEEGHTRRARWMPETCLRFHAGLINLDDFDKASSDSQIQQLMFHYCAAMQAFAKRDRTAAKEHLQKCAANNQLDWSPRHWARAMLKLMQDNPNWPDSYAD